MSLALAGVSFMADPPGKPRFSILMCRRHLFSSSIQKTKVSLFVIYLGLSFFSLVASKVHYHQSTIIFLLHEGNNLSPK